MKGFYQTYFDLLETIDYLIEKKRIVPALILLYSTIDSFSNNANVTDEKGRSIFKKWVKKWMLEKYPLPCDETDLYSARCGLLHQQISESNLTHQEKAKEIYYIWGNANLELIKHAINDSDKADKSIEVKIEDLIFSFKNGFADCLEEINKDPSWKNILEEKAKKFFVSVNHVL